MGQSTRQVQVKVKLPDWPVTTGVTMKLPGNDMVTRSARRTCWFHVYPQHLAWRPTWQLYTTPQVDSQISLTFRKKQFMCTPPGESLVVWIIEWVHPSLIHGKQPSFWRELRRGAYPEPQDNERRTNQNFSLPRYEVNQRCFLLQGPDSSEEKSVSVILVTYTCAQNTSPLQEIW